LQPLEAYLAVGPGSGLPAGVHHYDAFRHELEHRADSSDAAWGQELDPGLCMVLTSLHDRSSAKYGLRAYRYSQLDLGHAIAAVTYAAATLGWKVDVVRNTSDLDAQRLVGVQRASDFKGKEREGPGVALWIRPDPALQAPPLAPLTNNLTFHGKPSQLLESRQSWGFPALDRATRHEARGPVGLQLAQWPEIGGRETRAAAASVIRERRSSWSYDTEAKLPAEQWFGMLDALLPRPQVPPLDALGERAKVHPLMFVHGVEGVPSGLYILVRDPAALPKLKASLHPKLAWQRVEGAPEHLPLYCLGTGDTRQAAKALSYSQDIASDGAFAVSFLGDLGEVGEQPSTYVDRHREAGILGHILYLEAQARGFGGTGIGAFIDDAVHQVLALDQEGPIQALYHFAVGRQVADEGIGTKAPYFHLQDR
jgi:nitroreductase